MQVTAFVAHPDDEVLGCGGTLVKLGSLGDSVAVVLTLRRSDKRGIALWDRLIDSFHRSCHTLGAKAVVLEHLLDETEASLKVNELHDAILPYVEKADVVFTHWKNDANQVHSGVCKAVEIATRPFRRRKDVFLFEIPTSTDQSFWPDFSPNAYCLLSPQQVEAKLQAMAFYESELHAGRHLDAIRVKTAARGHEVDAQYAEAFCQVRRFF